MNALNAEVARVSNQFEHGNGNYGDIHDRVSRLMDSIARVREDINVERARRGRRF